MSRQIAGVVIVLLAAASSPAFPRALVDSRLLTTTDGQPGDGFGRSVAISGDTVIVGANGADDRGENAGAAYLFVRDAGGAWRQQQKLTPAELQAGDCFGWSVDRDASGQFWAAGAGGPATPGP